MRGLVREAGLEDEIEIDSAGTGGWHAGDPPDRRATAAAKAPRRDARGRRPPGPPARLRATTTCCSRWTARTCASCGRSRRTATPPARRGCCASSIRPRPERPTSTCPTPTTAARTASRRCSTRSRPPAAACSRSSLAVSLPALVRAATGREVRAVERVGGGDINEAFRVQFADESFGFVKTRADVAPGEYAAEAAGLRWLAEPGALRVPEVLGVADDVLVLDWVDEGGRGDGAAFGAGLAAVHAAGARTTFGGSRRRCASASLSLPNDPTPDWPTFYAERRLLPLLPHAGLTRFGNRAVERVCDRMAELAGPPEPPARLHGDLWSGNVLWGRDGTRLADRSGGLRRPSRGRPRDAAAVRLARAALPRRLRGAVPARAGARGARRRSTSCSHCSCTPRCSAAAIPPRPSAWPALRPSRLRSGRRRCS